MGFHKLVALGALMGFLEFSLSLFNVIAEVHAMDEKYSTAFSMESESELYM